MSEEFLHVHDWLELPPKDENEREAKEWLDKFLQPAYTKLTDGTQEWLDSYTLKATWKGKGRFICTGASRMGDVWLKKKGSQSFYDHRVDVRELAHWKRIKKPTKQCTSGNVKTDT